MSVIGVASAALQLSALLVVLLIVILAGPRETMVHPLTDGRPGPIG